VEVDGPIHRARSDYDSVRDSALSSLGVRTLRITNDDVNRELAAVLERIAKECRVLTPAPPLKGRGPEKINDVLDFAKSES
jgi:very-short-patch-repair endonuclease